MTVTVTRAAVLVSRGNHFWIRARPYIKSGERNKRAPHHTTPSSARSWSLSHWNLLAEPAARYTDLGAGYYQARADKDKKIKNHIRQIEALLGHPITITITITITKAA